MVPPNADTIAGLEDLAQCEPEALISTAWLVQHSFMRIEDIGDLREAGLAFFEVDDPDEGRVVCVEAAAFLRAAQKVAIERAAGVVSELAADSGLPN